MGSVVSSKVIDMNSLLALQDLFQKNLVDLIDVYLQDAQKCLDRLIVNIRNQNSSALQKAAKDLRCSSLDIGAIQFSHLCISIEMAAQEHRLNHALTIYKEIVESFIHVREALLDIKHRQSVLA